jgi:signal transduction histidine kinase/HAMP domain-containing protein
MGFRRSLALLVAGTLVPFLVFAVVAVHQYSRERNAAAEHALLDAARVHVVALDKHFEATITALRVLGTSEHLDAGDFRAFYRQCLRAIEAREEWRTISLFDVSGRRLLTTSEAFGSSLPGPPPAMAEPFRRLVEAAAPNVSDLFESPLSHQHRVSVGVPIARDAGVRWVISAGMSADALGKLVASQRALPDATVTLLDRRYRIVASSHGQPAIGEFAPPRFAKLAAGTAEGMSREPGTDGTSALTAFSRSAVFGWTASIAVPVSGGLVQSPVQTILGVGLVLLLTGITIAVWAGRRISRPIEALALAAGQIGRGEPVRPVPSGVTEVAALSAALVGASEDRTRSEADLAKASERLRILHEIDRGIIAAETPVAIAEATVGRVRELMGVPRVILNLFDLEAGEAEWLAAAGRRRLHVGPGVRYPLGLMGDVDALRRGELQTIDVDALPRSRDAEALLASGVHAYMVVPMTAGGELIGALSFGDATALFSPEQVSIAREVAAQMAIAIAQAQLHERVKGQAVELEQRVQERTRELEAANHELDAFSYSISHDLRAPLRAMQGFTEALLEDYGARLDAPGQDYAQRIVAASRRMDLLIQDLLAYSRLSRAEVELETVSVETVVDEVCAQLATELKSRGAEIAIDRPLGRVMAHRAVFGQVLTNLLSNAVKFVSPAAAPRIRIWTDARGDWVRLWVEDNGIGIAPEHRERIFRAFERLHGVEQYPGTGIGLAIVQRGIARLGGRVGVEPAPAGGSRFWVELKSAEA